MDQCVRGEDGFEYRYGGDATLCDLSYVSRVGYSEIFPELCVVGGDGKDDLVFYLSGESDCIFVERGEHPFDAFRDFYQMVQKYFLNADWAALLDMFEEEEGTHDRGWLLKKMAEAETVYLSARCYFSVGKQEHQQLMDWINTHLDEQRLSMSDLEENGHLGDAIRLLIKIFETEDDELPLLALSILKAAVDESKQLFIVHDAEEVWETPVLLDGEVVTAATPIGELDTPMFE